MSRPIQKNSYRQLALKEGCTKSTIGYRLGKEHRFQGICRSCGAQLVSKNIILFCDPKCHAAFRRKQYIEDWKSGIQSGGDEKGNISNYVRRYLFEKHNSKCQKCGWQERNVSTGLVPLEVNHIDGNCANHVEANLELICPNCHSLTPTFRSLNRGSKRNRKNIEL
jgi:hypothetical protein